MVLISGCVVVPCLFTTKITDVFYLPKLIGLWVLLAAVIWLVAVSNLMEETRSRFRWVGIVDVPVLAFVLLNLVALAFSSDTHQSLVGERLQHQGVLTTLLYVAFFYLARELISDRRQIFRLFVAIAIGAAAVATYAIIQKLGLDPIWKGYVPYGRVFSTIGQPNALAAYLVLAMPITAALAIWREGRLRLAALAGLALMVAALLLTYSRGGYLGLALTAMVFVSGLRERIQLNRAKVVTSIGVALVVLVLIVILIAPARSAITRAWNRSDSVSSDDSISSRVDLWRVAIRMIEDHPLVGTGPETFPDQFPRYSRMVLPLPVVHQFARFRVESPHDEVLAVAYGAGIPAAIAFLSAVVGAIYVLWHARRRTEDVATRLALLAVMSAVVGHVVTNAFMTAEITGSWLFWMLVGAGVGVAAGVTADNESTPVSDSTDGLDFAVEARQDLDSRLSAR